MRGRVGVVAGVARQEGPLVRADECPRAACRSELDHVESGHALETHTTDSQRHADGETGYQVAIATRTQVSVAAQ